MKEKELSKLTKAKWLKEVRALLDQHRFDTKPYSVKVCDITVLVLPGVFSPKYFPETQWFAEQVLKLSDEASSFLEIGCGAGSLVLLAALRGINVSATDINEAAVENTRANLEANGVEGDIYLGSLFDPLPDEVKFDLIFWNHPFHRSQSEDLDLLTQSFEDYDYMSLRRYVREAKQYLSTNGRLLLGSGDFADVSEIEKIATACNYRLTTLFRKSFTVENSESLVEEYIVYELLPA